MLNIRQVFKKYLPGHGNGLTESYIESFFEDFKRYQKTDDQTHEEDAFRRAVYLILEKMNEDLGSTRFRVPDRESLRKIFNKHKEKEPGTDRIKVTEKHFVAMLKDVINESRVAGTGGIDTFMYIFGVPITAWMVKQRVAPNSVSNDIFIPGVTSATIALLALFKKL